MALSRHAQVWLLHCASSTRWTGTQGHWRLFVQRQERSQAARNQVICSINKRDFPACTTTHPLFAELRVYLQLVKTKVALALSLPTGFPSAARVEQLSLTSHRVAAGRRTLMPSISLLAMTWQPSLEVSVRPKARSSMSSSSSVGSGIL